MTWESHGKVGIGIKWIYTSPALSFASARTPNFLYSCSTVTMVSQLFLFTWNCTKYYNPNATNQAAHRKWIIGKFCAASKIRYRTILGSFTYRILVFSKMAQFLLYQLTEFHPHVTALLPNTNEYHLLTQNMNVFSETYVSGFLFKYLIIRQ